MTPRSEPGPGKPLVSVVMATYNRSNILGIAIESVRHQTLQNWELWVIGDACTDDSREVAESFGDPRVRYLDLPRHVGEQSGPNNEGVRRSRGDYLAFLNHDDLWFPDHLETMLESLERLDAGLVWPLAAMLRPKDGAFSSYQWRINKKRQYKPHMSVPASLWVLRRELADRVGPWRHYSECYGGPSQDWLYRAWKAKAAPMCFVPRLTVLTVSSGRRNNAYVERAWQENHGLFERMRDESDLRETILTELVVGASATKVKKQPDSLRSTAAKLVRRLWHKMTRRESVIEHKEFTRAVNRLLAAFRLNPIAFGYFVRYGKKGVKIDNLRVRRGLPPAPPRRRQA